MLRALSEAGIRPDLVVGTSIGAVNGVFVALDPDRAASRLGDLWQGESLRVVFSETFVGRAVRLVKSGTHLHSIEPLKRLLADSLHPSDSFADLAVPFSCVAASIEDASARWFSDGPLVSAVMASCAVPGLLPPVEIDGRHYFDGGLVDSIPVGRAVALGATTVYVLHVGRIESPLSVPTRPWEVGLVAFEIARRHRFHEEMSAIPHGVQVHVLPTGGERLPPGLRQFRYRDKNMVSKSIERSYAAAANYLAQVTGSQGGRLRLEPPMLPPRVLRRVVLAPLVIVIAGALVSLTPLLAVASVTFRLVRWGSGRMRVLRLVYVALTWFLGEAAALAVCLCLWLASGFGGRLDTEPYQSRHYGVMRWFLDLTYRAAERACGLRVDVAGPPEPSAPAAPRPLIVFSRHAGPGDSLLLVRYLLTVCGRRPRIVMKATLQLDPGLDVLANRVPNAFLKRHQGGQRSRAEQVRRLARGLDQRGALLIFPEGANWTPLRWRRAIERLRRSGSADLARQAAAMPNVLPPRSRGALTAISACPDADVIFVAHTGTDRLVSVRDVWRSLSSDISIRARWWRVPASEVPRAAGHDTQVRWLYDWWGRVDAWIAAERASAGLLADDSAARLPEVDTLP